VERKDPRLELEYGLLPGGEFLGGHGGMSDVVATTSDRMSEVHRCSSSYAGWMLSPYGSALRESGIAEASNFDPLRCVDGCGGSLLVEPELLRF
jgi:hypothetical protein